MLIKFGTVADLIECTILSPRTTTASLAMAPSIENATPAKSNDPFLLSTFFSLCIGVVVSIFNRNSIRHWFHAWFLFRFLFFCATFSLSKFTCRRSCYHFENMQTLSSVCIAVEVQFVRLLRHECFVCRVMIVFVVLRIFTRHFQRVSGLINN